jgi:hypothetical protein
MLKRILYSAFALILFLSITVTTTSAEQPTFEYEDGCTAAGQCLNNSTCVVKNTVSDGSSIIITVGKSDQPNCNSSSIGGVSPPGAIHTLNVAAGAQTDSEGNNIGIIIFISNLIRLFAIVAGIWAMFNLIMGGYTFITSMSDAGAMAKVQNSITMTIIGLAIIAGAYIIAAVIGALLFGDPNFILNPQLQGALQGTTP